MTTAKVRLLIFVFGFLITILGNFIAQRDFKHRKPTRLQTLQIVSPGIPDLPVHEEAQAETWEKQIRTLYHTKASKRPSQPPEVAPAAAPPGEEIATAKTVANMPGTELHKLIEQALKHTRPGNHSLCVMEAGTGDGKGTTVQLVKALQAYSAAHKDRDWHVTSYEGIPELFQSARWFWQRLSTVSVVNQLVLSEANLEKFVYPRVDGPDTAVWPGKHFYLKLYNATSAQIAKGEMGPFISSFPSCLLDFVLVDATRFAHLAILRTLTAHQGLTDSSTIWLVRNEVWDSGGDERQMLQSDLDLEFVAGDHPSGETWPWIYFRVAATAAAS